MTTPGLGVSAMSEVAELVAGLRRRRENDGYDLEAVREIASHPSGVVELYGIIQKANVDRTHAADALETLAGENADNLENLRSSMQHSIDHLKKDRDALARENERLVRECNRLTMACAQTESEVQQILGKALGYPWFKDDPTNFPGAIERGGVCVGDHVAASLAMEAVDRLAAMAPVVEAARKLTDTDMGAFGDGADESRRVRHGAFITLCRALAALEAAHESV